MTARVEVSRHPAAQAALAVLRDRATASEAFATALDRLGRVLAVEALTDLPLVGGQVQTPVAPASVALVPAGAAVLVPILRAGLGLLPAFRALVPDAPVAMVGVVRDEQAHALPYLDRVPAVAPGQRVYVLDPMLATGGSASVALRRLAERGATGSQVTLVVAIAVAEGLRAVGEALPGVRVIAGAVDSGLNAHKYIVPGLGDAGDRLFGDAPAAVTEEVPR
jgi:uracil phosphoribosyltransferase